MTPQEFLALDPDRILENDIRFQPEVIERILKRIKLTDERYPGIGPCIEWEGPPNAENGYCRLTVDIDGKRQKVRVNRWVLQYVTGYLLPAGINALHKCDNRLCINPAHLFPGTHQDNIDDMIAKGRHATIRNQFQLTNDGYKEAMNWLKENNLEHLIEKELSTDGFTITTLANQKYREMNP